MCSYWSNHHSCVQPKVVHTPPLALAKFTHKKYGSRELIDILDSLGLDDSYNEVVKLVNAQLKDNPPAGLCGGHCAICL